MKKIYLSLLLLTTLGHAQVGVGTIAPNATLDVVAANATGATTNVDGILIPRVDRQRAEAMASIPEATMIYVNSIATGTGTGIGSNITSTGFYYYNTTTSKWTKIVTGSSGGSGWALSGNAGTAAGTDFIGTTDAVDFRIKTGGNDKVNIENTNGQIQTYSSGSATAPSYSFTPDTNTGVYSSGLDNVNIATGGTERVRVDAAGKIGINPVAAPTATLDIAAVNPTGTSTNVDGILIPRVTRERVENMASTQDATLIYVTALNGLGTVPSCSNITALGFYYYNLATTKWIKIVTGSGSGWGLTGNSGTTAGTNFIGTTDDTDFRIKTGTISTDRWNISHANAGQLQSYSRGTAALPIYSFQADPDIGVWSSAANILNFSTNGTERVRIDDTGKVGINPIAAPTATLDIAAVNPTGITTNVDGLLVPRVDRERARLMASPPAGTLIYVDSLSSTATAAAININATGFYYYDTVSATWVSYSYGQTSTTYYQTAGATIASTDTSFKSLSLTTNSITIPPNCTVLISYDIGYRTSSASASGYSAADFQLYMDGTAPANALGTYKRIFSFNTASVINAIGYASSTQSFNISAGSHTIDVLGKWFNGTASGAAGNGAASSALQGQITVTIIKK